MPYRIKKSNKLGLPPGVTRYSGDIADKTIKIEVINYQYRNELNEVYREAFTPEKLDKAFELISDHSITWIDIQGIHDENLIAKITQQFNFHPILTEDLLSPQQRPKLDIYENHLVLFVRRAIDDTQTVELETDQIAIILGRNFVISMNELDDDKFGKVKTMIQDHMTLFTQHKNDFLAYILLDFVVDTYFVEAERIDTERERIEDKIIMHDFQKITEEIYLLKKRNLGLRNIITPLREIPSRLRKMNSNLISPSTAPFLTDLEDHIYQLIDMTDTNRDLIPNLKESYSSELSTRMNEVMMTLTVVSSILLPLTFITSLYGMNFVNIPELKWKYGYFITWGMMIVISTILTIWFKRKKWL